MFIIVSLLCLVLPDYFCGGKPCFFNVFTDLLTPPEKLESANNIINQWNVLMYFVPFILSRFPLVVWQRLCWGYSLPN